MEGDVAYRHRDSSCLYLCKVLETFTVYVPVPTGLSHRLVRLTIFHPRMHLQKNRSRTVTLNEQNIILQLLLENTTC